MANPLVKELLIEMRDYNIRKAENSNLPAFLPSTQNLRELYNKVSELDMSMHAESSVVRDLERDVTERSLKFSDESKEISNASAKEVEKVNEHTDSATKNRIKERLNADRQKNLNKSKDTINSVYDSLIKTVDQHPEEELSILKVSDVFSDGFNAVIMQINEFIQSVIADLIAWAKRIWEQIKQVFNDVVNAISNWFASWTLSDSADQSAG